MKSWVSQHDINWQFADELAWKRSGFKDRDALIEAVRNLPIEKKIEMLTEIHLEEMAEMHFEEKQKFLLSLGHKTWVDAKESYEYAKKHYASANSFYVDEDKFYPVIVRKGRYVDQVNISQMKELKQKREGKNE